VVLFHAALGFPAGELEAWWWKVVRRGFAFGHEAVAIFIVLSGYCLMLPVARSPREELAGGAGRYLGRRAFRILPPYLVALCGSLLLMALVPSLRAPSGTIWDDSLPGLALGPVLSHVALLHNWSPAWVYQINGPLWSVATEWQIYFFFPLVLLPAWRRAGLAAALAVSLVLGYLPLLLVPARAAVAIPWYLALFWLGAAAAVINFSPRPLERRLRERIPWGRLSAVAWVVCVGGGVVFASVFFRHKPVTDLAFGIATAALLVHLTDRAANIGEARGRLLGWLESRPAVAVGHFSYSLYLCHLPVVALCYFGIRQLGLSPVAHTVVMLAVAVPASFVVAWGFYWAVERHFLRGRPR
jgi:peptidoglycan/LPS O-acetylase OafA/YrhL